MIYILYIYIYVSVCACVLVTFVAYQQVCAGTIVCLSIDLFHLSFKGPAINNHNIAMAIIVITILIIIIIVKQAPFEFRFGPLISQGSPGLAFERRSQRSSAGFLHECVDVCII